MEIPHISAKSRSSGKPPREGGDARRGAADAERAGNGSNPQRDKAKTEDGGGRAAGGNPRQQADKAGGDRPARAPTDATKDGGAARGHHPQRPTADSSRNWRDDAKDPARQRPQPQQAGGNPSASSSSKAAAPGRTSAGRQENFRGHHANSQGGRGPRYGGRGRGRGGGADGRYVFSLDGSSDPHMSASFVSPILPSTATAAPADGQSYYDFQQQGQGAEVHYSAEQRQQAAQADLPGSIKKQM